VPRDGPMTPDVAALFSSPRTLALTAFDYEILLIRIFDMVVKPFS
jgi:hypothetical protein